MKIGIEIHVALDSCRTKLFCACPNHVTDEPNTHVCPTCLGMPGAKPVLNARAITEAMKISMALNCSINNEFFFSRKIYFYPDMPKNYQITQYEIPLASNGFLEIEGKKIRITRVHIEEDPGKLIHMGGSITTASYVNIDYNRAGVPLCEIVTEPDFSSPKEVRLFLDYLSMMLEYMGVYSPEREGGMRIDVNISTEGERVEVKNITSFRDVEKALSYEAVRQANILRTSKRIERETRAWDASSGITKSLRSKEQEEDYGYIFDTDLPMITVSEKEIKNTRKELPEFAEAKIRRYVEQMDIGRDLAKAIATEYDMAVVFESVARKADPATAAMVFAGPLKKTLNYNAMRIKDSKITERDIVSIVNSLHEKTITKQMADLLLRDMVVGKRPSEGKSIKSHDELEEVMKQVLEENAQALIDYKSGKKESFNFLVGQVMRKTKGRGDPDTIRAILSKKLN